MFDITNEEVRGCLLKGNFGLEKESLRITEDGFLSHSPHPITDDVNIVRDFCENQTEINTTVCKSAREAVEQLDVHYRKIQRALSQLEPAEYLWPFSNPPYIKDEEDVPIAKFYGENESKTKYREYLSDRYGRYKMCYSGIHFNYSFSDELLQAGFLASGESDFKEYKNMTYVTLAKKAAKYGWLMTAVTAASPIMDCSFAIENQFGVDIFNGMGSSRCSEVGYWNFFVPIFDYTDVNTYADSIQRYVDEGLLRFPSELYYPIRLKPKGENTLQNLREKGVNHIELRMFDLNPLSYYGVDERDVAFGELFLTYLACIEDVEFTREEQIRAVNRFKSAAHYDLNTVKIRIDHDKMHTCREAGEIFLNRMIEFYADFGEEVQSILTFEKSKFIDNSNLYSHQVLDKYLNGFVKKGVELAKEQQRQALM